MARIVRTINVCDGCAAEAPHRHSFVFHGKEHTLDLCEQHNAEAVAAVQPWLALAVAVKPVKRSRISRAV